MSRHLFITSGSKVMESFHAIHNLEEELIAMLRPGAEKPISAAQQEAMKLSAERKDESRARLLGKIIARGEVSGSLEEIRSQLGLEDLSMQLFKSGCWFLRNGKPEQRIPPRILMRRIGDRERGWRTNEPVRYLIKPILH